ncbi:MAG TPA: NAD-dependent epimerase/dehydratase family protein [Planctomycetota bacterium]|nr:NAD-dependent epimerase/dehydratase family protein [Planctomycetota bacterium]
MATSKETVLVTGGAGFIGSHLVEALLKKKLAVRVLDNFSTGLMENLEPVADRVDVVNGDIRSGADLEQAFRGVTRVAHLASTSSVPRSIDKPLETHANNVDGTLALLEAARAAKVKRFVYTGGGAVYGDAAADGPAPISPYGVSALGGEAYAMMYHRQHGLPVVCLRLFNVYGPRQDPNSPFAAVIPRFLTAVNRRDPFPIYGDGHQQRDFTYVGDLVQALLAALVKPAAVGHVFDVGAGRPETILEVARVTAHAAGVKCQVKFMPARPGDPRKSRADLRQAKKLLGFAPKIRIGEGIVQTYAWFRESRSSGKSGG